MSHIQFSVRDSGSGVKFIGHLPSPSTEPTPAEIVGMFVATHPEEVAKLSWSWFAAQKAAAKHRGQSK